MSESAGKGCESVDEWGRRSAAASGEYLDVDDVNVCVSVVVGVDEASCMRDDCSVYMDAERHVVRSRVSVSECRFEATSHGVMNPGCESVLCAVAMS